jgi:ABC-type amino acid transport system permease subunit
MNWLIKTFALKYLKGLLDKLPLNGYKTVAGVVLAVLVVVVPLIPVPLLQELVLFVVEFLRSAGIQEPVSTTLEGSIALVIIGAIHKLLKVADK